MKRGAARMVEQGYKQVQLWLDAKEAPLIHEAAMRSGQRVATWIRTVAAAAAADLLAKTLSNKELAAAAKRELEGH